MSEVVIEGDGAAKGASVPRTPTLGDAESAIAAGD
jgi:hypothetical protein